MKKWTVYLIKENGVVRYVGCTCNFDGNSRSRKYRHINKRGTNESSIPVDVDLNTITFEVVDVFDTKKEALKLEGNLIDKYDIINKGWNKQRSGEICNDIAGYRNEYNVKRRKQNAEYKRNRRIEHRDEYNAYMREYRQTHKEQIQEWKDKNKEKVLGYYRKIYNSEKRKKSMQEYEHSEKRKVYKREYNKTEKRMEYMREYQRKLRLRKKLAKTEDNVSTPK